LGNESFSFDAIGGQAGTSQAYDGAGRLTSDSTFTYGYDNEGDLTSRTTRSTGKVAHFVWNSAHQLLSVTATDGTQTSFAYDPFGRRVDVTTSAGRVHTVYNSSQPIADYNASGALTASYVYGAGNQQLEETTGGSSYYYVHDALGSVTALTNQSGSVVDSYRYTAFGTTRATGSVPNPFTYIGAPTDSSTGLVDLNAR
jgi:YD repeat-containing protein